MRQRGFTMIELLITMALIGMTLAVGIPNFARYMQNTQNRTAAESILNGLQLARSEAVKRSTQVRFELTDATGKVAWNVGCLTVTDDCPANIGEYNGLEGNRNSRVGVSTAAVASPPPANQYAVALEPGAEMDGATPAGVTFNSMGRVIGAAITRIDVVALEQAEVKRYVLTIAPGGQIRMCDPTLAYANSPQGCI